MLKILKKLLTIEIFLYLEHIFGCWLNWFETTDSLFFFILQKSLHYCLFFLLFVFKTKQTTLSNNKTKSIYCVVLYSAGQHHMLLLGALKSARDTGAVKDDIRVHDSFRVYEDCHNKVLFWGLICCQFVHSNAFLSQFSVNIHHHMDVQKKPIRNYHWRLHIFSVHALIL